VSAPAEASEELLDAVLASASHDEGDEMDRLAQALPTALARLGDGQRRCLDLFYLEGHSYAEVASHSGAAEDDLVASGIQFSRVEEAVRVCRERADGQRSPGHEPARSVRLVPSQLNTAADEDRVRQAPGMKCGPTRRDPCVVARSSGRVFTPR
jgi:hypothetical protein